MSRPRQNLSRADTMRTRVNARRSDVRGIPVSLTTLDEPVDTIVDWCSKGEPNFVCVRDVHGIMRAQEDPELRAIHQRTGMVTPDGMPLVWRDRVGQHEAPRHAAEADGQRPTDGHGVAGEDRSWGGAVPEL